MEKLTNEEVIIKMREFRDDCETGNSDLFSRMNKSEKFKVGDQWDPRDRSYRDRKGKFCLTIPLIKPTIKQVVGAQIQNPKDVTIKPERNASGTVSKIRSRLVKHAMDSEHAVFELTQWFESGISSGVGLIGAFIDKNEDPLNGNLVIERLNEFECGLDPNCISYDINSYMNGAKYFIWEPWVDKDLIHEQYPDKVDQLEASGAAMTFNERDKTGFWSRLWTSAKEAVGTLTGAHNTYDNITKYKYHVTHTWWRRPKKCIIAYIEGQPETNAVTLISDKDQKEIKALAKKDRRLTIKDVIVNVMCHTVRVNDVLLENIEDELNGVTRFPIGVFSAYFDNGYRAGMVEDMIGTQEEINWGHSQNLQVVKHLSTYHWVVREDKQGAFSEWLAENADEDNLVIDESKGGGKVDKSQSRPYLSGLDRFVEIAKENLKLITNVRTEEPAFDAKNMSGKAIALKQLSSQTGQAAIFQNFDYSLSLFGQLIDEIIAANGVYSIDEIRAIVEKDDLLDAELMGQAREQVMEIFESYGVEIPEPELGIMGQVTPDMQMEMEVYKKLREDIDSIARMIAEDLLLDEIKNIRLGRYTTKVTLSPYAPTARVAEQAQLYELNDALLQSRHAPLSRKSLIEASDVKNKETILAEDEMMQQQMMQMAATQQQQQRGAA